MRKSFLVWGMVWGVVLAGKAEKSFYVIVYEERDWGEGGLLWDKPYIFIDYFSL